MLFSTIAQTSAALAATHSRLQKVGVLADCLRQLGSDEIRIGVSYLSGQLPQGRIGLGPAILREAEAAAASSASLSLRETDRRLTDIGAVGGSGAQARRRDLLGRLLALASAEEQEFLRRLVLGELRQGALEGVMLDAIVVVTGLPADRVRRALMFAADTALLAEQALLHGAAGLAGFRFSLFQPLQPMLAQPAAGTTDALGQLGEAVFEYKLDGARVQVHKHADQVRVFSRQLNEVTPSVPELVELVSALPVSTLVLDGEAIALAESGRPLPFQVTMQRFGRRTNVDRLRRSVPLSARFFDCLYSDGDECFDQPQSRRMELLGELLPAPLRVPHLVTADPEAAAGFLRQALAAGHEGIMAKALGAAYQAGSRGADWLKIKPTHTLDLVVLAAEWGSGRRQGKLSNLHLGARDPRANTYVMLGKTFKGLTDQMLDWQTRALLEREIGRDGHTVHVRPELVVEIAFNELQASRQYPGGLALRFARVKRYRHDKVAAQADTIDSVRAIFRHGLAGGPR